MFTGCPMLTRYLIVRPDIPWVQGDIPSLSPMQAVEFLETRLRIPPDTQHQWWVYEAPRGFPPQGTKWSGGAPDLIAMLDSQQPVATFDQSRPIATAPSA